MTVMTRSASASIQRSEFDDFLCAPIGDETNGMVLSVISALARLDFDPWLEAASLARMPQQAAIERMTALISALPDTTPASREPQAVATRLIALLPRPVASNAPKQAALRARNQATKTRIIVFLILMAFLLSVQFSMRSRQSSIQADNSRASDSSIAPSPNPTP